MGATINLYSTIRTDALLFGESQSRIVISFPPENREVVEKLVMEKQADFTVIGEVNETTLTININDQEFIKDDVDTLRKIWQKPLKNYGR